MSLTNTSNLVPSALYGKGDNGNVSMQITPGGIVLGGDLNTASPITATISQAGIITDNPDGFDILSPLNMNNQNITHSGNIVLESGGGNSITFSDNTIQTTAYTGAGGGDAILSAGTTGDPQVFTGFNVFDNDDGLGISHTTSTNFVRISCDSANQSQLDILGNLGIGNDVNGNLTMIQSDPINSNQLNVDGSLLIGNAANSNSVLLSTNTVDQQLDVGGAISVGNNLYMNNYDIDSIREAKFDSYISLSDSSTNTITTDTTLDTIRLTSLGGVYVNTTPLDNGNGTIYGTASKASTISITDSSLIGDTYYPTFVSGSGEGLTLRNDSDLTYNPSTNTLSASNFNGTISNATNAINANNTYIQTTIDNATHYLNFTANALDGYAVINKTLNTLTCNPTTGTITATTFNGNALSATNANNVLTTSDVETATPCYLTYVKTTGTGNKPYFIDDLAPNLTYTPSTRVLSSASINTNSVLTGTASDLTIASITVGNKIVFQTSRAPIVQCCQMEATGLTMSANKSISATNSAGAELIFAVPNATGNLSFTGTNIQSATSGGNSGQHLRIKLNGVFYKIALQNDV